MPPEASDCSAPVIGDVSDETALRAVPVEVALADATAVACAVVPAGLVSCFGELNGVNVVADAEAPA